MSALFFPLQSYRLKHRKYPYSRPMILRCQRQPHPSLPTFLHIFRASGNSNTSYSMSREVKYTLKHHSDHPTHQLVHQTYARRADKKDYRLYNQGVNTPNRAGNLSLQSSLCWINGISACSLELSLDGRHRSSGNTHYFQRKPPNFLITR